MGPLDELEALIEEARWVGDGEPFEYGQEDPLKVLLERMRGVEPEKPEQEKAELAKPTEPGQKRAVSSSRGEEDLGRDRLGALLAARLKERSLGGEAREKAVRLLTEILTEEEDRRLQEVWDLLVFGE